MTFSQKNAMTKLTLAATGSLMLLAMTGCGTNNPTPDTTPAPASSSASATASGHLGVSANFKPDESWTLIKEADRTKKSDTIKVHSIRWDTGDKLLSVEDIRTLFDDNGYTITDCYDQINNCVGTAPVEGGTVDVSISATEWEDSQTGKFDHNDIIFETSAPA